MIPTRAIKVAGFAFSCDKLNQIYMPENLINWSVLLLDYVINPF